MKKYCFDTSGISTPLETMPEDLHEYLWTKVGEYFGSGHVAVTTEIFGELEYIKGNIGQCIKDHKQVMLLEVTKGQWDWEGYKQHVVRMQQTHRQFISEYNGIHKRTICLNDISIIALAKTLGVPVVSMEALVHVNASAKVRRIPNICESEGVPHLRFNDFLRREKIKGHP